MTPLVRNFLAMVRRPEFMRQAVVLMAMAALLALLIMPTAMGFAQSDTLELDIDPAPLFISISNYVPLFFGILAVGGGILIGKKIAMFVINAIADAF